MALADTARLIASLELQDKFSGPARKVESSLGGLEKRLDRIGTHARRGLSSLSSNLTRIGVVATGAVVGGLTAAVVTSAKFEAAFTGVEKTVDATESEFTALDDTLKRMAGTTGTSFEELAAIGETGGALGIGIDQLETFIDVVNRLSVSTPLSADAAATALGQLTNILHLNNEEVLGFADTLVALGNAGASTEDQIIEIASRFGATAESAGISTDAVLALSSTVASMGIGAEAGGSSLSRLFGSVATNIGTANDKAVAFADGLGLTLGQFREAWDKDANGVFIELLDHLNELDQFEAAKFLKDIGVTNTRDINALRLLAQGSDEYARQLGVAEDAQGALHEESDKFFGTTARGFGALKQNIRNAADTFGDALLPTVERVITALNKLFGDKQGQIRKFGENVGESLDRVFSNKNIDRAVEKISGFIDDLAKGGDVGGGLTDIVNSVAKLPWQAIGDAARLLGTGSKALLDAFLGLPPWVQTAVLTGWGLNKLTGGALGGIAGTLTGALGKWVTQKLGLMTVQAAVVNVNGPGGGLPGTGPAGPGKGPGFLTGLLGTLGIAAAVEGGASKLATQEETITVGLQDGDISKIAEAIDWSPGALIGRATQDLLVGLGVIPPTIEKGDKTQAQRLEEGNRYANTLSRNTVTQAEKTQQKITEGNRYVSAMKQEVVTARTEQRTRLDQIRDSHNAALGTLNQIRDKKSTVNVQVNTTSIVSLSASQMALRVQQINQTTNSRQDINETVF